MKKLSIYVVLIIIVFACAQKIKSTSKTFSENLVGTWVSQTLKVEMKSVKNSDRDSIFFVDTSNWLEVLKIKPIITHFRADGTYNSEHYSKDDKLVYNPFGTWEVSGDSLFMEDTKDGNGKYSFYTKIEGDKVFFTGIMDFDEDGKKDDNYFGAQVRLKNQ